MDRKAQRACHNTCVSNRADPAAQASKQSTSAHDHTQRLKPSCMIAVQDEVDADELAGAGALVEEEFVDP